MRAMQEPRRLSPVAQFWVDSTPLRQRRRALDVSQKALAAAIGAKSYMTIHRIERNIQSPTLAQHLAIARVLGTPGTQLYDVRDGTPPVKDERSPR